MGAHEGTHGRSLVTFAGVAGVLGGWALGAVVRRFSTRTGVSDEEAFGSLPGDGIIDIPALLGALDAGGVVDWVDLEIFSDDASFTEMDFEDSLWKQDPVDVCRRGKEGIMKAWEARKAP